MTWVQSNNTVPVEERVIFLGSSFFCNKKCLRKVLLEWIYEFSVIGRSLRDLELPHKKFVSCEKRLSWNILPLERDITGPEIIVGLRMTARKLLKLKQNHFSKLSFPRQVTPSIVLTAYYTCTFFDLVPQYRKVSCCTRACTEIQINLLDILIRLWSYLRQTSRRNWSTWRS